MLFILQSTFIVEGDDLVHYQKGLKQGDVDSKITRQRADDDTMTIVSILLYEVFKKLRRTVKELMHAYNVIINIVSKD